MRWPSVAKWATDSALMRSAVTGRRRQACQVVAVAEVAHHRLHERLRIGASAHRRHPAVASDAHHLPCLPRAAQTMRQASTGLQPIHSPICTALANSTPCSTIMSRRSREADTTHHCHQSTMSNPRICWSEHGVFRIAAMARNAPC